MSLVETKYSENWADENEFDSSIRFVPTRRKNKVFGTKESEFISRKALRDSLRREQELEAERLNIKEQGHIDQEIARHDEAKLRRVVKRVRFGLLKLDRLDDPGFYKELNYLIDHGFDLPDLFKDNDILSEEHKYKLNVIALTYSKTLID